MLQLNEMLILVLIGLMAGFVGGTMGIGGGIIIVPALVLIMGFTQHQAQGTSLAVLLFPIGIMAVMTYYKKGYVNLQFALILIIAFILGSWLGSLFAVSLPDKILKKIFGIFMLLISLRMIFAK